MTAPSDGRRPICSSVYASVGCPAIQNTDRTKSHCRYTPQDTSTLRVRDRKWKAPIVDLVAVGLGVILWIFWLGATAVVGYAAWYFRQHSVSIRRPSPAGHDIEETTKNAFSSNDELPSLIETRMRTTATTDPPPITDVVEV
ncbi:hypothetical protein HOY80DRAFT_1141522 [Tuber brumale]|nr:hypothetical protein HOY80DRAFT_1141522 [Tuber brumale]